MEKHKLGARTLLEIKKKKYASIRGLSGIRKQIQNKINHELVEKPEIPDSVNKSIDALDFISFWVFLIAFVLFNIIYWNSY